MYGFMALTAKQQAFVDCHKGNTTEAAAIAGISREYAARMMQDVTKRYAEPSALAVQTAIKERNKGKNDGLIASREERQEFWSKIQRGELTDIVVLDGVEIDCRESTLTVRMKASELLGKSELDFGDRIKHEGEPLPMQMIVFAALGGPEPPQELSKAIEATIVPAETRKIESKENHV